MKSPKISVIIPTHNRRIIHNAASGIEALGYKAGAIAADPIKAHIARVAAKSPFLCIGDGLFTVI